MTVPEDGLRTPLSYQPILRDNVVLSESSFYSGVVLKDVQDYVPPGTFFHTKEDRIINILSYAVIINIVCNDSFSLSFFIT